MTTETLAQTYVVCDESGDFIEHSCQSCAEDFAKRNELVWHHNGAFTEEHPSGLHAYNTLWDRGESDTPSSCLQCGQYLDVGLTNEGVQYLLDNDFPEWLYAEYGVTR